VAIDYTRIPAVVQFDPAACWAASLEWWARAMGNRPVMNQLGLINLYHSRWDSRGDMDTNPGYGTVSRANLIAVLGDGRWQTAVEEIHGSAFTCAYVNQKVRFGPCIVGYYEPAVRGNHVVVAYGASSMLVDCMNPDGGRFMSRPPSVYQLTARLVVAWPTR
jgi:hypothetical protein